MFNAEYGPNTRIAVLKVLNLAFFHLMEYIAAQMETASTDFSHF